MLTSKRKSPSKNPYPGFSMNIFDVHRDDVKKKSKKNRIENVVANDIILPPTTTSGSIELDTITNFDRKIHKRTCTIKRSSKGNFSYKEEDELDLEEFDIIDLYRELEDFQSDYN